MLCPNCQNENEAEARFCSECGASLDIPCPNCWHKNPQGSKFRNHCGHRLRNEPGLKTTPQTALDRFLPPELAARLQSARATRAMQGERRIVTILFCDVKGSTTAAERLDPEEWTEIMNVAFEHMIRPIYQYEGTVARVMGDAILAFFGAPIAHEDAPQRAVLAGLEIISTIQPYRVQLKDEWEIDIDVRVGINTGLVMVGEVGSDLRMEYTAMGDAINLAARMEQTAVPVTLPARPRGA
jgi:class 3 adenylate cyclase